MVTRMIFTPCRRPLAASLLLMSVCGALAADSPARPANRLAQEKSPYLLQHAHNPVDWYPWGQEAFDRAKQENKPIFVDTYASWCEPCKWMDQNTFSQTTVGDFFNKNYISWKVDVEKGAEFISFDLKNSIGKNAQSESAEILIGSLPTKFTNC
jgi:thiol:disulfide interchange protein